MTANIKSPQEVKMGDTITDARHPVRPTALALKTRTCVTTPL